MALKTSIIHCLFDAEPAGFHPPDAPVERLAVNLGFECPSDIVAWSKNPSDSAATVSPDLAVDELEARARFENFIADAAKLEFHLFTATVAGTTCSLVHIGEIADGISDINAPDAALSVVTWLDHAAPEHSGSRHYWTTPEVVAAPMNANAVVSVDATLASATYRLRSAHSWNAPVAHRLGLTHIVKPATFAADTIYVILPFFGAPVGPLPDTGQAPETRDPSCSFTYNAGGATGDITCRTELMAAATIVATSGFITDAGYLKINPDAEGVWRVAKWFEARAASLMSPVGALAGPGAGSGAGSGQDADYRSLFPWSYKMDGTLFLTAPAPAWLATTSLCASLDSLIIGIMQPASKENTVGDILAPLIFALAEQFESTAFDAFILKAEHHTPEKLAVVLRNILEKQSVLANVEQDFTVQAVRGAFCTSLRYVHDIPLTVAGTPADIQLLNLLLTSFTEGTGVPIDAKLWPDLNNCGPDLLQRALAGIEQRLNDETGAETAIIRLLETVEFSVMDEGKSNPRLPHRFAKFYLHDIEWEPNDEPFFKAVETAFANAWAEYQMSLAGPFNGAEAVRRAASSVFTKALLTFSATQAPSGMVNAKQLVKDAQHAEYHAFRILGDVTSLPPHDDSFKIIRHALVRIPCPLDTDTQATLKTFLQTSYRAALAPMASAIESATRFIPDHFPAPLPIQIAQTIDGVEIDDFLCKFNGIGVAIRRIDTTDGADLWAHASLAKLSWPVHLQQTGAKFAPPIGPTLVPAVIHPMLPAVGDGRGPMFIEYEGFPLAARTFSETSATAIDKTPDAYLPFYEADAPDPKESGFVQIPRLAYGRAFEAFSFATSNSGSLPLALQATLPWMPKANFAPPSVAGVPDPDLVTTTLYQRRTAIGQMAVNEAPVPNNSRRIGVPIKGVMPLSSDYPRTVMSAFASAPGVCDLFRTRDGVGTLVIPALIDKPMSWQITETVLIGKPQTLVARLFNTFPTGPQDDGIAKVSLDLTPDFDLVTATAIEVTIVSVHAGTPTHERHLSVTCGGATKTGLLTFTPDISAGWLRLSLESADGGSLSFAVTDDIVLPDGEPPLLLLATDAPVWKADIRAPVRVVVDTPRIGYLDFERWFANADLCEAGFKGKTAKHLKRALMTAYVLRDADKDLARALDRLPDPAVDAIRLELSATDQLVPLSGPPSTAILRFGFFETMADIMAELARHDEAQWSLPDLHAKLFEPLERAFRFTLELASGPLEITPRKTSSGPNLLPTKVTVPPGLVARLSMDALVSAAHFEPSGTHPPVFHAGLKQHASRHIVLDKPPTAFLSFRSAAICIEAMIDGMGAIDTPPDENGRKSVDKEWEKPAIRLAADMIAVRPIERSRRYDLETRSLMRNDDIERRHQWRLLGEIDVTTQRWHNGGRPIYNHIDPKSFFDPEALPDGLPPGSSNPAIPLTPNDDGVKSGLLFRFEAEAFFNRPNIDSQTVTQRLLPLPVRTVLQQHLWDAPSATYFRHRFTLRSRYAGALKNVDTAMVRAWVVNRGSEKQPAQDWTLRIAMLADLSRMLLTRPQQRALIPLTIAPRDDGKTPLGPPVLSILQEPPFSRGGLADRIAAELKTGFNYGFADKDAGSVEIIDSRKEIGPDPRLTYRPTDQAMALGMVLNAEGPMGLTFDPVNAPAPAFPNSMISLSPLSLTGDKQNFEEHFLGVSLRRYIDPNWTIAIGAADTSVLDAERCWWITPDLTQSDLISYAIDSIPAKLLTIAAQDGFMVVSAMKAALDGGISGKTEHDIPVARWRVTLVDQVAILHRPIAPERYSTSIFVKPKNDENAVIAGRSNAPLLICTIEWGPPLAKTGDGTSGSKERKITLNAGSAAARIAMASAPTFLAWTRMGRNFDTVCMPDFTGTSPQSHQIPVRDLTASITATNTGEVLTFDHSGVQKNCWLACSTFVQPFPLHVQRHLAILTSGYLKEPGRPVEEYQRSSLLVGRKTLLARGTKSEDCLRIVEFETPAAILCGSPGPTIPEPYRKAYFDLVSTGFRLNEGAGSLRFFIRLCGSRPHLKTLTSLTIVLSFDEAGKVQDKISICLKNVPAGEVVTGIVLADKDTVKGTLSYTLDLVCSNGDRVDGKTSVPGNPLGFRAASYETPGFFLELVTEGTGEFWADISLLHSPSPASRTGFSFDWLFSKAGSSDAAFEVSDTGLHTMVEAQARIVSVSPPIPITSA